MNQESKAMNQSHNFKKLTCAQCGNRHAVTVNLVDKYACDNCSSVNFSSAPGVYTSKQAIAFVHNDKTHLLLKRIYRRVLIEIMMKGNSLTRFAANNKFLPTRGLLIRFLVKLDQWILLQISEI